MVFVYSSRFILDDVIITNKTNIIKIKLFMAFDSFINTLPRCYNVINKFIDML